MRFLFLILAFICSEVALADWPLKVMNGTEGQTFNINDQTGPFVLEFYFRACPACVKNAPNVDEVASQYHGTKGKVLEIGIDCSVDQYQAWIREHSPKGLVLNGCDSDLIDKYGVTRYPTTIVLKPDRTIAGRFVGVWSSSTKDRIKRLLDNNQP